MPQQNQRAGYDVTIAAKSLNDELTILGSSLEFDLSAADVREMRRSIARCTGLASGLLLTAARLRNS